MRVRGRTLWVDLAGGSHLEGFAASLASAPGIRAEAPEKPESVADALSQVYGRGKKLVVVDG